MTAEEFENRVVAWARALPDIEALVQIGSRVQPGAVVDVWSDWDYQLIVRHPERYRNRDWPAQIAPCWSSHFELTERGVTKVSTVFANGVEADFVLLSAWQIKLVCWGMRRPGLQAWFPRVLRRGISNFRLVVSPGYRVLIGGAEWTARYSALSGPWPEDVFSEEDFKQHTAAFWRHAAWISKKILRGELRAAMRWAQVELSEHTYALLMEEARLDGRIPRPEARQAERWLVGERLNQTARPIKPERAAMTTWLTSEIVLFSDISRIVAARRGFAAPDYTALQHWLLAELSKSTP